MTERQKQHLGRSEGDETVIEGRDIKADAPDGTRTERANDVIEDGVKASQAGRQIDELLEKDREKSKEGDR